MKVETLLNTTQAAAILGIGSERIRALSKEGRLGCRVVSGRYRYTEADLNAYLEGKETKARAAA